MEETDQQQEVGGSKDNEVVALMKFAESLVDKIIAEAFERRTAAVMTPEASGQAMLRANFGPTTGERLAEWTQEKNGTLSHMVEQTAFVEAKPRDGSSKKQRRRKSGANNEDPMAAALGAVDHNEACNNNGTEQDHSLAKAPIKTTTTIDHSSPQTVMVACSQQEGRATGGDELLGSVDLAGNFQTGANHAQAQPGREPEAHANSGLPESSGENILESACSGQKGGNFEPSNGGGGSSSGGLAPTLPDETKHDPERGSLAADEAAATARCNALASVGALENVPSEQHDGRRTRFAQCNTHSQWGSSIHLSKSMGPGALLKQSSQLDSPDLDVFACESNEADGGDGSSYREPDEQEECNFDCATPDVANPMEQHEEKPPSPLDGFESGDFSMSTTTEDTTIMAVAPSAELNVNVSAGAVAAQEQFGSDGSFAVQEGFMGDASGGERAGSELGDLDSGERTRGWGCGEHEIQAKFKDTRALEAGEQGDRLPAASPRPHQANTNIARTDVPMSLPTAGDGGQPQEGGISLATREEPTQGPRMQPLMPSNASQFNNIASATGPSDDLESLSIQRNIVAAAGNSAPGGRETGTERIDIELQAGETKQSDGASSPTAAASEQPQELCADELLGIVDDGPVQPLGAERIGEQFTHQAAGKGFSNSEDSEERLSTTPTTPTTTEGKTTTTSDLTPSDTSELHLATGVERPAVVASDICSSVVQSSSCGGSSSSDIEASRLPAAQLAEIKGTQQQQTPRRPTNFTSSKQNTNNFNRISTLDDESSQSSSSTSQHRPKSELIVGRKSFQTDRLEYFAATDSELDLQKGLKPRKFCSIQGHMNNLQQQQQKLFSQTLDQQQDLSNSSSISQSYATAPLASQLPTSSSSNADFVTLSTSLSLYETARSNITATKSGDDSLSPSVSSPTNGNTSEMVSFSVEDRIRSHSQAASSGADTPTMTPNTEELEEMDAVVDEVSNDNDVCTKSVDQMKIQSPTPSSSHQQQQQQQLITTIRQDSEILLDDSIDEEQLRRILACKRLSEGCNRFGANFIARKNSLHMIEELPPLTEGETMKHMSYHLSQTIDQSTASSSSSGSLRARPQSLLRDLTMKRGSQDENTSCSSSTSLERSPTRRRSSTVSQCSSVLSESTRNQLNFDLSPDLPPDSSLLEANAISPIDMDRPASPEPSSLSGEAFEFRPISRMSHDEQILPSPDSTLGDSNDNEVMEEQLERLTQSCCQHQDMDLSMGDSESNQHGSLVILTSMKKDATISEHLERIISDVSSVAVSGNVSSKRPATDEPTSHQMSSFGQKSARSSGQNGERRSSLNRPTTPSSSNRANSNSPESPLRHPSSRPKSVATNQPTSYRSNTTQPGKSSLGYQRTQNTPSPSANSNCSSSSSLSSGAASRSINRLTNQKNNDEYRLRHVIEMEQKDTRLRQKRQATSCSIPDIWQRKTHEGSIVKKVAPTGHRHTSQESGPLCYCHNL